MSAACVRKRKGLSCRRGAARVPAEGADTPLALLLLEDTESVLTIGTPSVPLPRLHLAGWGVAPSLDVGLVVWLL